MASRDILYNQRLGYPPDDEEDPNRRQWRLDVMDAVNALPTFSVFSQSDPNSKVTAQENTIGVNLASGTPSVYIKESGSTNIGWVSMVSSGGVSSAADHGSIGGLTDDDHSQYLLLAGRSGQSVTDDVAISSVSVASASTFHGQILASGGVYANYPYAAQNAALAGNHAVVDAWSTYKYGIRGIVYTAVIGTGTSELRGALGQGRSTHTIGTQSSPIVGVHGLAQAQGSAGVITTSLRGVSGKVEISSGNTQTVTGAAALYAESGDSTNGTMNNLYGLFVEDQTDGVNSYAVKTNAGLVEFGDETWCDSGLSVASVSTFGDGTNYTHIAANGFQSMAGTARYWHGDDLTPGTVKKGPTPPAADQIDGFAFDRYDRETEESVFHVWHVPHNMATGSASVRGHYDFVVENPPSGDTETVVMGFEYKKLCAGDVFDFTTGTSTGTLAVSITSADAAYKLYETGLGYPDTTGWAHDDKILFRFYRDSTYAGDTYDNEVTAANNDVWVKTYHIEVLCDTFGESAI